MARKISILGVLLSLFFTLSAQAEIKVAVVDQRLALNASQEFKEFNAKVKKEFQPRQQEIKDLQKQVEGLNEKLQKDGEVMSETEKDKLYERIKEKTETARLRGKQLQDLKKKREVDFLKQIAPKFQQAIKELAAVEGYDLVVQRESLLHFNTAMDITPEVTKKLDDLR